LRSADVGALAHVRTVHVGTCNEPKLVAVREALAAYVGGVEVVGHAVDSGVPEQPVGFAEIVDGARNRARAALGRGPCDLAVGIEDGLVALPAAGDEVLNVGAAVVCDGRREAVGLSSGFAYPPACSARAIAEREPIGALFDALWRERTGGRPQAAKRAALPSARSVGNVGKLSLGVLTRAEYGRHAVLCALLRFLHPDLYFAPGAQDAPASGGEGAPRRAPRGSPR
jgi:inosine/xanthosine triphosphatase